MLSIINKTKIFPNMEKTYEKVISKYENFLSNKLTEPLILLFSQMITSFLNTQNNDFFIYDSNKQELLILEYLIKKYPPNDIDAKLDGIKVEPTNTNNIVCFYKDIFSEIKKYIFSAYQNRDIFRLMYIKSIVLFSILYIYLLVMLFISYDNTILLSISILSASFLIASAITLQRE